jgi:hypothetical protein
LVEGVAHPKYFIGIDPGFCEQTIKIEIILLPLRAMDLIENHRFNGWNPFDLVKIGKEFFFAFEVAQPQQGDFFERDKDDVFG